MRAGRRASGRPDLTSRRAAGAHGLRYSTDREPGIRRLRRGRRFVYVRPDGRQVTQPAQLARIRSLAVPPAYRDVWICLSPHGHLQAVGRDARGRKQYRYHHQWRAGRDEHKFDRMLEFMHALPRIRRRVARDLRRPGLPRARVLATVVRLLETTLIRVGNEEYARSNGSFGLTTLRDRHVDVRGETLRLEFRGKSGIRQSIGVSDPLLARIVRRCADIPGQELFQWIDARGGRHRVDSSDVNDYLREAAGDDFTAKDFRTWFATVEAMAILRTRHFRSARGAQRQIAQAVQTIAARLGNTPAVCRRSYIHPVVIEACVDGRLQALRQEGPAHALGRLLSRQAGPAGRIRRARNAGRARTSRSPA